MIGIYGIYDEVGDKWYIGSSIHINKRKIEHFSKLRNNKHENKKLQSAFNINPNLQFLLIEELRTIEKLLEIEESYINEFDSYYNGYNQTNITEGSFMQLLSVRQKHWGELHGSSKYTNLQIEEALKLLASSTYTASKIEETTGVDKSTIHYIIKGGHEWVHLKYPELSLKIKNRLSIKENSGSINKNSSILEVFRALINYPSKSFDILSLETSISKETISAISSGRQYQKLILENIPEAREYYRLGRIGYAKAHSINYVYLEECKKALEYVVSIGAHCSRDILVKRAEIPETVARKITELDIDMFNSLLRLLDKAIVLEYLNIRTSKKCSNKIINNYNYLISVSK